MTTIVAKLGGNALDLLDDALAAGGPGTRLCLVHGGGAQISALMRARGIEPRFVGGRRATDLPTLACVRQALAGVSDGLVEALAERGVTAEPMRQGECLRGRRLVELGLVGAIASVDAGPLEAAWAAGRVPLVAPLATDGCDRFLNCNADDVAAAIAGALAADELVFLSDVPGVLDEAGAVIPALRWDAPPTVGGGMVVKLEACGAALAGGVGRVRIGRGTEVTA